jgi:uroporphyrinogen III methyltransferase/synthase
VRGLEILRAAEVVVYDRLVAPRLLDEAPVGACRIFAGKGADQPGFSQAEINTLLVAHARWGRRVVRLKGGDPFVFGRGGEEALALAAAGVPFEIVPGVTSALAVPAYAGIPLTHRGLASSFAVVTGHEDGSRPGGRVQWASLARAVDTLVVLMGLGRLPEIVATLLEHGRSPETPVALIRWGTTPAQVAVVGTLETIVGQAHAASLTPPVVAVIGDVVSLHARLGWFEPGLAGVTALGPGHPADRVVEVG